MKSIKALLFLSASGLLLCYSCRTNSKKVFPDSLSKIRKQKSARNFADSAKSDSMDEVVMKQVEKLPEFKRLAKHFETVKHRDTSHHLAVMVAERPNSTFKYYWVKVGDNGPDLFQTILHFYVNPGDLSVYYLDTATDSIHTLKQWRKMENSQTRY